MWNQRGVVRLAVVSLMLSGCIGNPCELDSCIGPELEADAFSIPLRGLDEDRGCWGPVGYLNIPWSYVRSVPLNDHAGCLFDLRTQRAYDTPQSHYDLDYDSIGWRPCDIGLGYGGDGSEAPPICSFP